MGDEEDLIRLTDVLSDGDDDGNLERSTPNSKKMKFGSGKSLTRGYIKLGLRFGLAIGHGEIEEGHGFLEGREKQRLGLPLDWRNGKSKLVVIADERNQSSHRFCLEGIATFQEFGDTREYGDDKTSGEKMSPIFGNDVWSFREDFGCYLRKSHAGERGCDKRDCLDTRFWLGLI